MKADSVKRLRITESPRQEDYTFKCHLGNLVRLCLEIINQKIEKEAELGARDLAQW